MMAAELVCSLNGLNEWEILIRGGMDLERGGAGCRDDLILGHG